MNTQFSTQSCCRILTSIVLVGGVLLTGMNAATATNTGRTKAMRRDAVTDHFFHSVNPELKGRQLTSSDSSAYLREWTAINAAVEPLIRPETEVCYGSNEPGWEFGTLPGKSYAQTYDYLTDVIFYNRHPEMQGKKLRPGTSLAREWSSIRRVMFIHVCGL